MDVWITNTGTTSHTWSLLFGGAAAFTRIFYAAEAYTATSNALSALLSIFGTVATAVVVTGAQTSATENARIKARGFRFSTGVGIYGHVMSAGYQLPSCDRRALVSTVPLMGR